MHDYHLHTPFCKHAEGEMEEYVETAIENGVTEICFADHIPLPNGFDAAHRMSLEDMEPYIEKISLLKRRYREISILMGIEADYIEGFEEYLEAFLDSYPFDLVIMAVHFIRRWPAGQWVYDFEYTKKTIRQRYKDYFYAMIKGIKTGLFDVVGHLDLVKRKGLSVVRNNQNEVKQVLEAASQAGMSIELNVSGLWKPINDIYPSLEILEMVVAKGLPIVMGSDAHKPEYVGACFDELLNHLFNYKGIKIASYQRRKCIINKLAQPEDEPFY
ncbi:MAG: histidinol-phosphatase HisJ [Candidatus Aminicenantes bacterium]|nr:MAG: histidinol-phosphatase HisJ [Candidatus Aminicenantes bacterium]